MAPNKLNVRIVLAFSLVVHQRNTVTFFTVSKRFTLAQLKPSCQYLDEKIADESIGPETLAYLSPPDSSSAMSHNLRLTLPPKVFCSDQSNSFKPMKAWGLLSFLVLL